MNHSIGPWSHKHDIGVYDRNGRLLVEPSCRIGYDEAIANARIIAAAPELLEALRDTLYFVERHSNRWDGINGKHPNDVVEFARKAIAKATNA